MRACSGGAVGGDTISVAAGTIDQPTGLRTVAHIHTRGHADYYEITGPGELHPGGLPVCLRTSAEPALRDLGARPLGLRQRLDAELALRRRRALELDLGVGDDLEAVAPRVEEVQRGGRPTVARPSAATAARTASLSSTTSPKWRP